MGWFNLFNKVIRIPFLNNLFNRLVNKYTAHGIIIIIVQLESLGIIPRGISNNIDGLAASEILLWAGISVGIYFIFHMPKPKNKLEKLKHQIELNKLEIELEIVKNDLKNILIKKKK